MRISEPNELFRTRSTTLQFDMARKTAYTKITPLPSNIPRQLALDMLHSHGEIIELNPLVLEHHPIKAPQTAARETSTSQCGTRSQRGYNGCQECPARSASRQSFMTCRGGLQTHAYAPMGVDLRNKWQIRGNQPGEPREVRELGSNAPHDGLYLREDIEIVCNLTPDTFRQERNQCGNKGHGGPTAQEG